MKKEIEFCLSTFENTILEISCRYFPSWSCFCLIPSNCPIIELIFLKITKMNLKLSQLLFTICCFLFGSHSFQSFAQAPDRFNYQGIARDEKGTPLQLTQLFIKIEILPTQENSPSLFEEEHEVRTNEYGLYTLQIGGGQMIKGSLSSINWSQGNKFIAVSCKLDKSADYIKMGITQLLSVPFAIYANSAGALNSGHPKDRSGSVSTDVGTTGTQNYLPKFSATPNTITNSRIFDNGSNIGIGTITPNSKLHLFSNSSAVEHLRMENVNALGTGKFMMYNDVPGNYATFTKYGSTFPGGYPGITSLFPYANLLAFGNNGGGFLISNSGNIGLSILSGGVSNLKFFADKNNGRIGIGGNASPAAQVHFNNSSLGDTLKITNAASGHLSSDGFDIRYNGTSVEIMNQEADALSLGTSNTNRIRISSTGLVGIGTTNPTTTLDVAGTVKISGGNPASGKVLTSDANGLASWQVVSQVTGSITGFVRLLDQYGNSIYTNLSGATVTLDGTSFTTTTNVDGKFTFTNVPAGTYSITVTKTGYGTEKLPWVSLNGGVNPAYVGSIKLSKIPDFNVASVSASASGTSIVISGTVNGSTTYKRTVGIFIGTTSTVSASTANYIAFENDAVAAGSNIFSATINAQQLTNMGFVSGNTVYVAVYSINADNGNASTITDITNGRKQYTAIGTTFMVANVVMP